MKKTGENLARELEAKTGKRPEYAAFSSLNKVSRIKGFFRDYIALLFEEGEKNPRALAEGNIKFMLMGQQGTPRAEMWRKAIGLG